MFNPVNLVPKSRFGHWLLQTKIDCHMSHSDWTINRCTILTESESIRTLMFLMETWGILGNHHTRKSPPVSTVSRRKLYTTMSTMAWQSSPTATTTTPSRRALRTMGRFSRASMCHTPLPFWCWIFRRSTPRSRFSSTPETPLVNTPKSFVASAALTFGSPTRTCYATAFQKKKKPGMNECDRGLNVFTFLPFGL